jgi:menaquinone-dependent protoporphyrinogen oxidase
MTEVLVAFGSKMGGTAELGAAVAARLEERGIPVDLRAADEVRMVDHYTAFVVGSAIYTKRWRPEVIRLLGKIAVTAPDKALWLFHSGPLGDEAGEPQKLPKKVSQLSRRLNIKGTMTFGGRMPEKPKGLMATVVAREMAGDWRDFADVVAWTDRIADALLASEKPG